MEAATANGTTAFGNWAETSDPQRALVFSLSWSLDFMFSEIVWTLLVSSAQSSVQHGRLSAIPHCCLPTVLLITN